jgi:hypothetical protein
MSKLKDEEKVVDKKKDTEKVDEKKTVDKKEEKPKENVKKLSDDEAVMSEEECAKETKCECSKKELKDFIKDFNSEDFSEEELAMLESNDLSAIMSNMKEMKARLSQFEEEELKAKNLKAKDDFCKYAEEELKGKVKPETFEEFMKGAEELTAQDFEEYLKNCKLKAFEEMSKSLEDIDEKDDETELKKLSNKTLRFSWDSDSNREDKSSLDIWSRL